MGGAASAVLVAYLAEWFAPAAPFWFAVGYCAVAVIAVGFVQSKKAESHHVDEDAALVGAEEF